MKFLQTGDIFWGARPEAGKTWSRERAADIRTAFAGILAKAGKEHADLLLIAGNLFQNQPSTADLRELNRLFLTAPDTRIILTAGDHDRLTPSSAALHFPFAPNVTLLSGKTAPSVAFRDLGVTVAGFSWAEDTAPGNLPEIPDMPEDGNLHLFVGALPADTPVPASVDYAALGGTHSHRIFPGNRAGLAGSPEPLSAADTGEHGILAGEIGADRKVSLTFLPTARASYLDLSFTVTPDTTAADLLRTISESIRAHGASNIYRIRIQGCRHPDEIFSFESLELRCHILEIQDLSEPQYDFGRLLAEHPSDMIGFYIQKMRKPDMSPVQKKALYEGVRALLLTSEERREL
jgi:exonuclease SbcD